MAIGPRAGLRAIPLVGRRDKRFWQIPRDRASLVIHDQLRWYRRPAVSVKHAPTDKRHKPGPLGVLVVVCRHVKAKPGPTAGHIFLKGVPLRLVMRKLVEPH